MGFQVSICPSKSLLPSFSSSRHNEFLKFNITVHFQIFRMVGHNGLRCSSTLGDLRKNRCNLLKTLVLENIPLPTELALSTIVGVARKTPKPLMARSMKGCYLNCTDPETAQYFASRLAEQSNN